MEDILTSHLFWKAIGTIALVLWAGKVGQQIREQLEDWGVKRLYREAEVVVGTVWRRELERLRRDRETSTRSLLSLSKEARGELRRKLKKDFPRLARKLTDEALDAAIDRARAKLDRTMRLAEEESMARAPQAQKQVEADDAR